MHSNAGSDPEKDAESSTGPEGPSQDQMDAEALDSNAGDSAPSSREELLHRKLKGRHMQMIAIGGSIGTGLFVGSGSALQSGGPASLVISTPLYDEICFIYR